MIGITPGATGLHKEGGKSHIRRYVVSSRIVIALLAWGALAMGSVQPWGHWPLLGGVTAFGAAGLSRLRGDRAHSVDRWLSLSLLLIAGTVLLQLVPLPTGVLSALSPWWASTIEARSLRFAHPLSIDPRATAFGLVCFVALSVFFLGTTVLIERTGARRMVVGLMGVGTVVASVGLIQESQSPGVVYGVWEPSQGTPYGSFLNKNHFAGWMLMALAPTMGYVCARIESARRDWEHDGPHWVSRIGSAEVGKVLLVLCVTTVMALAILQAESRAGMLGLVVAVGTFAGLLARKTTHGPRRLLAASPLLAVLCVGVAVTGIEPIADRFASASWTSANGRLAIWRQAGGIARDFAFTGSGLNTFETVSLSYQTAGLRRTYAAAHNDYLQLAADGGLLVGLPVLAAIVLFVRQVRRRFAEGRDDYETWWLRTGAVVGLCLIAAQELVDFSLQIPGNAALSVVLAAIAIHRGSKRPGRRTNIRDRQAGPTASKTVALT